MAPFWRSPAAMTGRYGPVKARFPGDPRLGQAAPANEGQRQKRHKCHRKWRRDGLREGLCPGERRNEPPFLSFEREHRQEGYGDDGQAEKDCAAHLAIFSCS